MQFTCFGSLLPNGRSVQACQIWFPIAQSMPLLLKTTKNLDDGQVLVNTLYVHNARKHESYSMMCWRTIFYSNFAVAMFPCGVRSTPLPRATGRAWVRLTSLRSLRTARKLSLL